MIDAQIEMSKWREIERRKTAQAEGHLAREALINERSNLTPGFF
jgi:hypothetical protein